MSTSDDAVVKSKLPMRGKPNGLSQHDHPTTLHTLVRDTHRRVGGAIGFQNRVDPAA